MSIFDKRENAFEGKFALDAELQFKAEARRNRMLGLWAAGKLGKTGAQAEEYAQAVVTADIVEAGSEDVYRKIKADFEAAGVDQSEHQIRRNMDQFMATALESIKAGH
jgi:hypothetical protein